MNRISQFSSQRVSGYFWHRVVTFSFNSGFVITSPHLPQLISLLGHFSCPRTKPPSGQIIRCSYCRSSILRILCTKHNFAVFRTQSKRREFVVTSRSVTCLRSRFWQRRKRRLGNFNV